jgi:hypothetical protein
MTDLRQAAQAVLNAWNDREGMFEFSLVIEDLDKALEQPEQGPVAIPDCGEAGHADGACGTSECLPSFRRKTTPPAAQPEQVVDCPRCGHVCSQRKWVGLTDEEVSELSLSRRYLVREVEAKLKERNT